mmetsp:Transcript_45357/g.105903  ORF Transcript_45357/g.105903 Transcript_45357/m.105903 type:complete len:392 (-) Transcript_45357:400-1575(-)
MTILLKFFWGDDVRRVRVPELTLEQVHAACLRIFAEKLAPENEDAIRLEFLWQGVSTPLTATTFPELVISYGQMQVPGYTESARSLKFHVVDEVTAGETAAKPNCCLQKTKTEPVEEIPAPVTPPMLSSQDLARKDIPQPQTPETPFPQCTKQELEDKPDNINGKEVPSKTEHSEIPVKCEVPEETLGMTGFIEADDKTVRKAARHLLKQVQKQRDANRRDEKKAASKWKKAKHKALKRMEKVARKLARRAASEERRQRKEKRKQHKQNQECRVRSEPEADAEETGVVNDVRTDDSSEARLHKRVLKERRKAAKRLQRAARKAKKHRRRNMEGERATDFSDGEGTEGSMDPEKELRQMVAIAFRGLLNEADEREGSENENPFARSWVRPVE